ncbi:MAG TPA: His/Gly/Thr/Pro-type tRNA ligase C-terminal domain-containing protein, partial [Thermomicrobiales bacterium]|nr:His/Gly/Thr/Pro-type tRNA ligase C-terminal domain-containing protein [Thermomicrobiales bacterium]
DYYTGPVFEAVVERPRIGSVAGAGRYDGLIGSFSGRSVPATGLSLGIERIIEVVREHDLVASPSTVAQVFVAYFPETVREAVALAGSLRDSGVRCDLSLLAHRGLGEQMKYAGRKGLPLGIIVGPEEISTDTVVIRALNSGSQQRVGSAEAVRRVQALVGDEQAGSPF